jgi:S-DNA-T family DNA segregation ATPase FtsK/SpoIIIE
MHSSAQPPKPNNQQAKSYAITRENQRYASAPAPEFQEHAAVPGLKPDPFAGPPAPSWLQFFTMGSNARFTRTPDYLLRTDSGAVAEPQPIPAITETNSWVERPADSASAEHLRHYVRPPETSAEPAAPEPVAVENSFEIVYERLVASAEAEPDNGEWHEGEPADLDDYGAEATVAAGDPTPSDALDMADPARSRLRKLAEIIQIGLSQPPAKAERQDNQPVAGPQQPPASPVLPAAGHAEAAETSAPQSPFAPEPRGIAFPSVRVNVSFAWAPQTPPEPAEITPPEEEDLAAAAAETPVDETAWDDGNDRAAEGQAEEEMPAPVAWAAEELPIAPGVFELPPLALLKEPSAVEPNIEHSAEYLDKNSMTLQQTLHDFGIRGEIIDANPGPVVTLYELEPAPGTKSSRVIGLADDIARSMSAISARVAVVPGRNVIGIELPNQRRETVWLRELLASREFEMAQMKLGLCLGKTIGGVPVIVDLARMPHLLVAGTTGSGKSVSVNAMILSLLYRHTPEACRMIMIDPKMLELSIYEGIPHLLTPVVTDPRKAVVALKWAVREMEERYKKMSRLGVRNLDGFNARANEARSRGTDLVGSDGEPIEATPLPYIVVIVDEMADLMMVAGKEIEGAIQRLAQMARAAGIHLIMATQRPSVDVITGTIKANFPTRISFQVTSKIDSRTILGEQGAEQLLGQGDMLYMAGGGRLTRVHGPFVSDGEVEQVVEHLKRQGRPDYLDAVTTSDDEEEDEAGAEQPDDDSAVFDKGAFGDEGADLYDQAVMIVMRDKKASTSYIQRRLQIGYNRAASIMERMENEGIVGPANHAGKREILVDTAPGFRKP